MISSSTADILHLSSFYPSDSKIVKIVEDNNQISIYLKSQTHVWVFHTNSDSVLMRWRHRVNKRTTLY